LPANERVIGAAWQLVAAVHHVAAAGRMGPQLPGAGDPHRGLCAGAEKVSRPRLMAAGVSGAVFLKWSVGDGLLCPHGCGWVPLGEAAALPRAPRWGVSSFSLLLGSRERGWGLLAPAGWFAWRLGLRWGCGSHPGSDL